MASNIRRSVAIAAAIGKLKCCDFTEPLSE
jgi:hypothetical protein